MITLYGRFKSSDAYNSLKVLKSLRICSFEITSEDVEDNRTTKSIGSSTVNVLLQHTIKLCLPQVLSELYQLVGYFLGGGEGLYGNESLFIGCKVSSFVTHIDFAPQISTSGLKFRGTIRAIGSVFDLNTGISVLLDVVDDFECNTVFLLTGEAVRIRGFLSIGDKIEIINPKKFYWGSNTARGGVPNDQFSDSYIVTCIASVVHLARTDLDASSIVDMLSIGLYNQLSSKCLVTRDILAHQEIDVELEIIAVHLTGWIRVSVRGGPQQQQQQQHFYLYVAHAHVAWVMHVFRHAIGATVRACNVLPVFLWNKMRGFAFTGRSSISVLTLPKALVDVNSKSSSGILTVPAEIRESCHMYTAFRADLTHRLSESVLNLSSMKHASRRLVLCIELMACDYQQQLPSSSTSSEYKDMFILYNDLPLTDARSLIRQSASLKKLTHGKNSMQEEFSSAWHAAFYAVRGGCDIDSLCAQLPYVVSVKSIFRNIEQKVRTAVARCGLASLRLFATHVVELFAKDDGSHPLNLIVAGSLVKWESMRCGEGGQFCSLCVVRDAEGEELQVIVTDCAQSTSRELEKLAVGYANTSMSGGVSFRVLLDGCGEMMRVVESPPVVLIHRPMCVFEENPSNSKTLADVKLIASARDIKLFSSQSCPPTATTSPEDQNDRTGVPQKRKFGDLSEAPTVSTSFTGRCSVRDILLRFVDRSRGSVSITAAVYGVVIYKEKNLAFGLKKQRCALTLRDEVFDDSLILYIPLVSAALVTVSTLTYYLVIPTNRNTCFSQVGMHIEVNESRLSVSKGKKESLYLDFVRGIRITKIADTATMQRLCQRNLLSAYAATALNRTYIHQTPPAITLEKFYNSSRVSTSSLATCPDRVLWTLTGHIIFIREIHVRLRCKSCYTNLANRYCVCSKGCGGGASSAGAVRYTLTCPNNKTRGGSPEPLSHEESLRMSIVWVSPITGYPREPDLT